VPFLGDEVRMKPQHWKKMGDLFVCGLLSRNEVIAGFLERLDASKLEEDIHSLPPVLFDEIARHFRTTPVFIPKPFFIGPATPESLRDTEQIWREKPALVEGFFK